MQDPVLMTKRCALEELVHETSHGHRVKRSAIAVLVHILLEVLIAVLEDKDKFRLCVYDIVEADDVDVLEFLHEGNLTDGGRGRPFLCVEMYLLERNDLISRSRTTLVLI
jgi:hypothetical protein